MADPASIGTEVSAGIYHCSNCGDVLQLQSVQSLPAVPEL
jgi:hypothetical protein